MGVLGLAGGARGLARADALPPPDRAQAVPEAPILAGMTLGRSSLAASLLWAHTSRRFAAGAPVDLVGAVAACMALDPSWTAPARYGSLMLGLLGDVAAHEEVLHAALEAHPEDPWFPGALGVSRWLHGDDPEDAARWLDWAARVPGADPIYAHAARRMARRAAEGE